MKGIKFSATVPLQYDTVFSPFPAAEREEAFRWLKTSGFDGIEPCISDYDGMDVSALAAELEELGLGVSTISTGQAFGREGLSLTSEDASLRRGAADRIKEHIEAAALLSCKVTVGLLRGRVSGEAQLEWLKEGLTACAAAAKSKNVRLLFEPINRYETGLMNSAAETAALIDELDIADSVELLWDAFHANIEDPSFDGVIARYGGRIGHFHLADSNRAFPGCGRLDFGAFYTKLAAAGFSGYMSFECLNLPSAEYVREHAKGFIERMRAL